MRSRFKNFSWAVLALLAAAPARGQFRPEETARRAADELFLRTAEILRYEEIGEGVTKPLKLYLKLGEREAAAVWKNPEGVQLGFLEGWRYEIAAYELDKLIGLNMIPPAVEREFQGKKGALILWAENEYSLLKVIEQRVRVPDEYVEATNRTKWLARAWDSLIANEDRTQQNVLYTEDWRTILIDHSRSFRSEGEFAERLMFGRDGIKKSAAGVPFLFRRLPRSFVDNVRALTAEKIAAAVGPYLTEKEIAAVLARRDLLLKEVADMVRERGEADVLY
jgi:hypothetical protein